MDSNKKKYPTEQECYEIIAREKMLPNIIDHSVQVKNVALRVYENLKNQESINRGVLTAAALLHDIAKTKSILEGVPYHDRVGGECLRSLGYDYIGEIIENHVFFKDFRPNLPLNEKDIVYYADKRVMHDKIVTIEERISDIATRYGKNEEDIRLLNEQIDFVRTVELKIEKNLKTPLNLEMG